MFAAFDEFHQLFVSNRTGRLFDIVVDTSGSIIALIIMYFYNKNSLKKVK